VTPLYLQKLALYFADKWWSLSRYIACGLRDTEFVLTYEKLPILSVYPPTVMPLFIHLLFLVSSGMWLNHPCLCFSPNSVTSFWIQLLFCVHFFLLYENEERYTVCGCLRHYARSRKVADSSPDEVLSFKNYLVLPATVYPRG
jgi:hypothetical protein